MPDNIEVIVTCVIASALVCFGPPTIFVATMDALLKKYPKLRPYKLLFIIPFIFLTALSLLWAIEFSKVFTF